MPAPSRFISVARALIVLLSLAAVVSSCAAPRPARRSAPPPGLPAVFTMIPDNVTALSIVDTDAEAARWVDMSEVIGADIVDRIVSRWSTSVFGAASGRMDARTWIGAVAGGVVRVASINAPDGSNRFAYAAVRDRDGLEEALRAAGWVAGGDGDADTIEMGSAHVAMHVWRAPARARARYGSLAISDDGLIAAVDRRSLDTIATVGSTTSIADRAALAVRVVEAIDSVPVALVFRSDIVKLQSSRAVQDEPATLELARWLTSSTMVSALREGWVGLAPPLDTSRKAVRVVGNITWTAGFSPDLQPAPVRRASMEQLPASIDAAVALNDPGALLDNALRMISSAGIDFATELDVPEGPQRTEVLPLLAQLDGDAAFGYDRGQRAVLGRITSSGGETMASDLQAAARHAGVAAVVEQDGAELRLAAGASKQAPQLPDSDEPTLGALPRFVEGMGAAGAPGLRPFTWIWLTGDRCVGPLAGWATWDEAATIKLSVDVPVRETSGCDPLRRLAILE